MIYIIKRKRFDHKRHVNQIRPRYIESIEQNDVELPMEALYDTFEIRPFHRCIRSCWFVAFSLVLAVLFHLLTSFIVCHAILICLASTESLILLIWFCMYSVCYFRYMFANSFCASLSFRALVLVGFFLLHLEAVFMSARFSLTINVSHGTLVVLTVI